MTAHLRLVLGPQRGLPALSRQAEIVGHQGGLDLQVVAVGEDSVGPVVRRHPSDDRAEVTYIARQDLDARVVAAVRSGLIREQRDVQAEVGRGGQEASGDRVGGVEGKEIQPHGRPHFGSGEWCR